MPALSTPTFTRTFTFKHVASAKQNNKKVARIKDEINTTGLNSWKHYIHTAFYLQSTEGLDNKLQKE